MVSDCKHSDMIDLLTMNFSDVTRQSQFGEMFLCTHKIQGAMVAK
jgi:hypothetical protein